MRVLERSVPLILGIRGLRAFTKVRQKLNEYDYETNAVTHTIATSVTFIYKCWYMNSIGATVHGVSGGSAENYGTSSDRESKRQGGIGL